MQGNPRMLTFFSLAAGLIIVAIVSLATKSWIVFAIAIAIHFSISVVALRPVTRALAQQEKPGPVEEARLDEERADGADSADDGEQRKMAI